MKLSNAQPFQEPMGINVGNTCIKTAHKKSWEAFRSTKESTSILQSKSVTARDSS